MILMGQGMGMLIEAWKVTKAVDIKFLPAPEGSRFPYRLDIQGMCGYERIDSHNHHRFLYIDKHVLSADEKKTQEYGLSVSLSSSHLHSHRYDKEAFRYVSYVAIPLLAGYTIYSLIYETHRGWYSFIISTLTSFVYLFGFVSDMYIYNSRLS